MTVSRANKQILNEQQLQALYQYAMTLCQQRDDAYDLLQSAVEKYLIEIKGRGKKINKPEAFLRTLIRNRFIDSYRYEQRWQKQPYEESAPYDISPVALEQVQIDLQTLEKVWSELSAADRDILYRWAVLGNSIDQVSEQLDIARGTLLSRIHRIRKRLQQYDTGDEQVVEQ